MGVMLEKMYSRAMKLVSPQDINSAETLPAVNPHSPEIDDLFAWGAAVMKRGNMTPEDSAAILSMVREHEEDCT